MKCENIKYKSSQVCVKIILESKIVLHMLSCGQPA